MRRFIDQYQVDGNATQAAIRAGYKAKNADAVSCRLLKDPRIAEAVEAKAEKVAEKLELTAERVLKELARVAFVDIAKAYDEDGNLLPVHKMPEDVRRAIGGIDVDELWGGAGKDRSQIGLTRKLKLLNKTDALELLGKHFRLFVDRVEDDSKRFEGMSDEQVLVELLKAAPASLRAEAWKKVAALDKAAAH